MLQCVPCLKNVVLSYFIQASFSDQFRYIFWWNHKLSDQTNMTTLATWQPGFGKLEEICNIFNMTNIVKVITCYIKIKKSTIDHLLTKKTMSCRMTNIAESGLSDCHKLISLFIKSYISRLKPKTKNFCGRKIC